MPHAIYAPRTAPDYAHPLPIGATILSINGETDCWDGAHNEAPTDYYRTTKPPRTPAEREAADEAVRRYQAFMNSIPAEDRQPITRIERLPRGWRSIAWGRHR